MTTMHAAYPLRCGRASVSAAVSSVGSGHAWNVLQCHLHRFSPTRPATQRVRRHAERVARNATYRVYLLVFWNARMPGVSWLCCMHGSMHGAMQPTAPHTYGQGVWTR